MLFVDHPVVIRGGGDLGTGVVYRLHKAGFPVTVLELEKPLAIRRAVSVATAVLEDEITIEGMVARRVASHAEAAVTARQGDVAVLIAESIPAMAPHPAIVVDARLAKERLDTEIGQGPLVVALGPGFTAGVDCHAVVETMRGPHLGRVLWEGNALPNTGVPGTLGGESSERVVRADRTGTIRWSVDIGDRVAAGDELGHVDRQIVAAPIAGVVRGLIAEGHVVSPNLKIADIDPRNDPAAAFEISDKALAVGGGVVEAALTWMNRR